MTAEAQQSTPQASTIIDVLGAAGPRPPRPSSLSTSLSFGWRALLKIKHVPEQLFDVTAFPIMFTLLFTYLFGGALAGSTDAYIQFLLPGILVQTVVMITMYTGVTMNKDIEKGVFDRFRSLPIWRPSPLVGALLGDVVRYTLASVIVLILGLVLGFRPQGGLVGVVASIALLLVFSFCLSWIWTMIAMIVRTEAAVMGVSMFILFPLTFASNIFVDPNTMPGWLRAFVDVNPVSFLVTSLRGLMQGDVDTGQLGVTLVLCAVLLAVFGPITMRLYNRKS
ncbi:ABC transporter permease [Rhodococcus ruber]|uniref:Transport permease protein n=1 Tax=Rhodococcus ruber TaxID=1830 RepID=A0ABT4MBP9_9NOCA|nr:MULTISPECIES: ABC transporter permease [Rhodococcus]MCZ4518387.1 ABC transporter permease [Rhodococcus ruber]OZC82009.1 ABC transporter permease [Rhodococcus sp. 06-412-2C]OZD03822.1 ABC transporter permease [Rhodococcus sp. 06-412-2B]QII06446.1 ABC transporter permease [Rhodococcus fascians A25f]